LLSNQGNHIPLYSYEQLFSMVRSPEYFQFDGSHFYLLDTPNPVEESNRIEEAFRNLAENVMDFLLENGDIISKYLCKMSPLVTNP
jgi:hypothetical protein